MSLTFDDGPSPRWTPQVLDLLDRYGARATFFVVGQEAERHPDLIREIVARGHQVAGHTWSHVDLRKLSEAGFVEEVDRSQDRLRALAGAVGACVRPPFGSTDATVEARLGARGLATAMWTRDSRDWERPGVDAIVRKAVDGVTPGDVILLHDGGGDRSQTVAALGIILERLAGQGLRSQAMC